MERFDIEIINAFKQALDKTNGTIVLIPHVNADGDATGSVFGFRKALVNYGKNVKVLSPNSYANYYHWMEGHEEAVIFSKQKTKVEKLLKKAEMMICMDFNHQSRAGDMQGLIESYNGLKVMIDHHPNPSSFCDIMISDPSRSSTAELAYALLKKLELQDCIDQDVASLLYTGIMTDTGSFNYNVSDPETFASVSELLEYGIDQDQIHSHIYDNFSADRMRLMGFCLNERMKVFPEYHAACMYISKKDQSDYNFQKGDSEGFVNLPLSIKGVVFSAFFTENEDYVKVSFRSKGSFPVNEFSEQNFNGGGHRNAAGGEIFVSLEEALTKFESLLPEYQELLNKSE